MLPWKTLTLYVAKHANSRIFLSSVTENELFMTIKFIEKSRYIIKFISYILRLTHEKNI